MTTLFKRRAELQIGTVLITGLDFKFEVVRTLARAPNTAEISIKNLSEDHRRLFSQTGDALVSLRAGYGDDLSRIFYGSKRDTKTQRTDHHLGAVSVRDGADIITTISARDGIAAHRGARVNQSFGAGTSVETILRHLTDALGIDAGNAPAALRGAALEGVGSATTGGPTVVSGNVAHELHGLMESAGLEWSIQENRLQVLRRRQALEGTAVVLTSDTGLVGVPTLNDKGVLTCQCLLIPDVFPGRKIKIQSRQFDGLYRVDKDTASGDTQSVEWYHKLEMRKVST